MRFKKKIDLFSSPFSRQPNRKKLFTRNLIQFLKEQKLLFREIQIIFFTVFSEAKQNVKAPREQKKHTIPIELTYTRHEIQKEKKSPFCRLTKQGINELQIQTRTKDEDNNLAFNE